MELGNLAQELMNTGCQYGQGKSGQWWVWWGEQRTFLVQCRACRQWLKAKTRSKLCSDCYKTRYNRTEYHRNRRDELLKGAVFNCVVCGEKIEATRKTRKTCSDACRKKLSRNPNKYPIFALPEWTRDDAEKLKFYERAYDSNLRDITRAIFRGGMPEAKADELAQLAWEKFGAKAQALTQKKNYIHSVTPCAPGRE